MVSGGFRLWQDARALVQRAAQLGMENPGRILHLSPREIELEFAALAARNRARAEQMDMAAWLAGRYVLAAMHAPRRYPRRPDAVKRKTEAMVDADMKRVFTAMAIRREEKHGDC